MSKYTIKEAPPKLKPAVDPAALEAISVETLEDGYVYVHCHFRNLWQDALIRIWKTTFLVDRASGSRSKLIHAENISFAPVWTTIGSAPEYTFVLIFEALPRQCALFDLLEDIPQAGGFCVENIRRNFTDVYHIDL